MQGSIIPFIAVEGWDEAQALADQIDPKQIHEDLVRTAMHPVKPDHIATFHGRKLNGGYQDEMGNDFHTRIQGTRVKHHMGKVAVKMYDQPGLILQIEAVANDVTFFKHHRWVEHRDDSKSIKIALLKKSIHIPRFPGDLMWAAIRRYLRFISTIDDAASSLKDLEKISRPAREGKRTYPGFNLFHGQDLDLFWPSPGSNSQSAAFKTVIFDPICLGKGPTKSHSF